MSEDKRTKFLPKHEVFMDIETIPEQPEAESKTLIAQSIKPPAAIKKQETIDAWINGEGKYEGVRDEAIDTQYRKTGLTGSKGEIITIAWAIGDEKVKSLSRDPNVFDSEADMLRAFFGDIKENIKSTPYFVGHFVAGFDMKFIFQRAVVLGVNPGFEIPFNGRHGQHFFDTQIAWVGYKDNCKLEVICDALGIPGKPDDIDGSQVWDYVKAGMINKVEDYNAVDVELVRNVFNRMMFREVHS